MSAPVCMMCGGPGRYNEHARFVGDSADRIRCLEARVAELEGLLGEAMDRTEHDPTGCWRVSHVRVHCSCGLGELQARVDAALGGKK